MGSLKVSCLSKRAEKNKTSTVSMSPVLGFIRAMISSSNSSVSWFNIFKPTRKQPGVLKAFTAMDKEILSY